MNHYASFEVLAKILSSAFGGSKKDPDAIVYQPQNSEQAKYMLAKVLGT